MNPRIKICCISSIEKAKTVLNFGVSALALVGKMPNGIGRTHSLDISRNIAEQSPIPIFLADGLNANNVKQALDIVQPFGLDICSGVRIDGNLDKKSGKIL